MWYIREPNKTALVCGITGRSYTYRLSGSFNQRTVAIELAGNMMLMLFFIVFVGVPAIVVGVGVGVIFVIIVLLSTFINNIEQGGGQMQCQRDQLVPGPGEVSNGWPTKHQKVDSSFLDICPVTE